MKTIGVLVTDERHRQIKERADAARRSMSAEVNLMIDEAMPEVGTDERADQKDAA